MVDCPNCNRIYNDDFDFCPYCGTKKPDPKICPHCEIETYDPFSFCPKCGTELINKIEFDAEINYIINLIINRDFDNANFKWAQLIEKGYDGPTIYSLLEKIDDSIEREKEMKKNEERKNEFRKIVESTDLNTTSKSELITKINNSEIITENHLKEEISTEARKSKFRKIVESTDLDTTLKSELITKINNNVIISEDELKKYISRRKNCSAFKKKEEDKKTKFMKMVEGADLDSTSKSKIIAKINGNSIRFESTLNHAIKTEEYETKRRRYMKKIMGKK